MIYSLVYGSTASPYNVRALNLTSAGLIVTSQYGVSLYTLTPNGFMFVSGVLPAGAVNSRAAINDRGNGNLDIAFCDTNTNTIYYATCANGVLTLSGQSLSGFWLPPFIVGVINGQLLITAYFSSVDLRFCLFPFYTSIQPVPRTANLYGARSDFSGNCLIVGSRVYDIDGSTDLSKFPNLPNKQVAPAWQFPPGNISLINNQLYMASGFPSLERVQWIGREYNPPKPQVLINNGGQFAGFKHRAIRFYGSGGYVYDLDGYNMLGNFAIPFSSSNNFVVAWLENCYVGAVGGSKLVTFFAGDVPAPSIGVNAALQRQNGPVPLTRLRNLSKVYPFFGRK